MKNKVVGILLFLFVGGVYSQNNKLWKGYFSYNSVTDISEGNSNIIATSENAIFKRNIANNQTNKLSTVDGLSGQKITQVYYSKVFNKTIIGYETGLIIVINENDNSILNVVDILNKASVPQNQKKINHLMEYKGKLYISTGYGISVFDLANSEFGDTYFIGSGGANVKINQTTVYNNEIFAVADGYGILKANANNNNLIDYNQWSMFASGNWLFVESSENKLIAQNTSAALYSYATGGTLSLVSSVSAYAVDAKYASGNFIITLSNMIAIYDSQFNLVNSINQSTLGVSFFTCATKMNNKIYIGTQNDGVRAVDLNNINVSENITPNGPLRNRVFRLKSFSKGFWAVYGDYSVGFNPYPLDSYGVSKFQVDSDWKHIPYQSLFDAKSISGVLINPKNENEVYLSSYFSGLIKVENDIPKMIYNNTNSSLSPTPLNSTTDIRVAQPDFDKNGNIWMVTSLTNSPMHQFKTNGQWNSYNLSCIQSPLENSYNGLVVDKNGTKWVITNHAGVVGFNETKNKCITITHGQNPDFPAEDIRCLAIDNKNKLWIGTVAGLRVLQNVDQLLTQNQLNPNSIIILEGNTAEELLFNQFITDIVVDGANNKWVATAGAGVFHFSSDGQKTLHRFTTANSPLPNDTVIDLDINETTGEVFFVTDGGVVSYDGTATKGRENFENLVIYPNPVRPEFNGNVVITGLMDKSNVKITDIEGNLVYEAISEGGTVEWNTTVFGKNKVASGVYLVLLTAEDGSESQVGKVMVVR
ncbi:MAG: two-component regulator propeller domain-containing protein [Limnohabitans sp.]|nr:two-component regulator propeller domain-containing protein [Limnohabitans sp.]